MTYRTTQQSPGSVLLRPLVVIALAVVTLTAGAAKAGWKHVKTTDGVVAHMSENPRSGLPIIRIRTRIDAKLGEVLGVVTDVSNSCKWAGRCIEAKVLREITPLRHHVYSRRKGPWPISDRDFELKSKIRIARAGHLVTVKFWSVSKPTLAEKSGVVRMKTMRGHYRLTWAGPETTDFEFQVEADPGGWIPTWVYRWSAEMGPLQSAKNLRKYVPRVKASYAGFVDHFNAMVAKRSPAKASATK